MGEFRSELFRQLYDAADVTYNPNKGMNEIIHPHGFTNEDAQRLDRMKTGIMRVLLCRAYNFMKCTNQDSLSEKDRVALTEFVIEFATSSIFHKDAGGSEMTISPLGIIPKRAPEKSALDWREGKPDEDLNFLFANFLGDVRDNKTGLIHPRFALNCS